MSEDLKEKTVKNVSILGIFANLMLLCIKLLVGIISKSQSMIADGINSAGDIFASFVSYIGSKLSSKPKDDDHPYGHGKNEYICTILISIAMLVTAVVMFNNSIISIINKEKLTFSIWLVIVAIFTIITKAIMFFYVNGKYKKYNNILLRASKEDHRNDMFVTTGTLIGIISSFLGYYFVDGLVGALISIYFAISAFKLFKTAYYVLIDTCIDRGKQKEIIDEVIKFNDVVHVDNVNSKPAGFKHVVILKISMDGNKTLKEGHELGAKVKAILLSKFDYILDVIVHINPH